jgi:hypothetical protein
LIQLFSFESIAVMSREDRRSDTTVPICPPTTTCRALLVLRCLEVMLC